MISFLIVINMSKNYNLYLLAVLVVTIIVITVYTSKRINNSMDDAIKACVQKLVDATNFNIGYKCCQQVSFSLLDMAWHSITEPFDQNFEAFEKEAWAPSVVLPEVPNTLLSTSFGHVFSGGDYAAGYYGYKWAEVLEADAFAAFKEAGIFSKAVATSFYDNILSKGDIDDPNRLYIRFRCQQPTIEALLQRNGLARNKIKR